MIEIKNGYIPITEISSPKVSINLNLPPWIDPDKIGLNLNRLETFCRIGGIGHLIIAGVTGEETSSTVPMIVGMNEQGGAYAGKAEAKVASIHSESFTPDFQGIPHANIWANGKVNINLDEMKQRISNEKRWKEGVHSYP